MDAGKIYLLEILWPFRDIFLRTVTMNSLLLLSHSLEQYHFVYTICNLARSKVSNTELSFLQCQGDNSMNNMIGIEPLHKSGCGDIRNRPDTAFKHKTPRLSASNI